MSNNGNNILGLTKKGMLAYLNIKLIGMQRIDHQTSDNVNVNFLNASADAGRYFKCKIARSDLSDVIRAAMQAREIHARMTRPWGLRGWGLLPAKLAMDYTSDMRAAKSTFDSAVLDVQNRWQTILQNCQARLGSLYDPGDYPDIMKVPDAFHFDYKLRPIPDGSHFILDLEKETMDEIRQMVEDENKRNLQESKVKLIGRLIEPVEHMANILGNNKTLRETVLTKIESTVEIIKDLNIDDDQDLADAVADVENKLVGFTRGQIKDDPKLRQRLAHNAEVLADKFKQLANQLPN